MRLKNSLKGYELVLGVIFNADLTAITPAANVKIKVKNKQIFQANVGSIGIVF